MEHRDELSMLEWFNFLLRKESREDEWRKLREKFQTHEDRESILQAFLSIPQDEEIRPIVAQLIEDDYAYFYNLPSYQSVETIVRTYPRDSVERGVSFP